MRPMARPPLLALLVSLAAIATACGNAGRLEEACASNNDCAEGELCALNFCTGLGFCEARPETCDETANNAPVCGCDGFTYPNTQCANFDGVRLRETIPCPCASKSDCVDGQYCAASDSCEGVGECFSPPESCEPITEPVCGCDGETYPNECEAAQARVRVSANGPCDCETNDDCASDEYCDALVCDGPGGCALRNDPSCEPAGQVTGCDGVIYANQCEAAQAGVRVRPDS